MMSHPPEKKSKAVLSRFECNKGGLRLHLARIHLRCRHCNWSTRGDCSGLPFASQLGKKIVFEWRPCFRAEPALRDRHRVQAIPDASPLFHPLSILILCEITRLYTVETLLRMPPLQRRLLRTSARGIQRLPVPCSPQVYRMRYELSRHVMRRFDHSMSGRPCPEQSRAQPVEV